MASDPTVSTIRIPICLWLGLILGLRRRSANVRESGAFLFARQNDMSRRVIGYRFYDDLDPAAHENGIIAFHAAGHVALSQYCKEGRLQVIADVHTHPGADVQQSGTDQRHPMLPVVGHTAMIVPNFGRTAWWSLSAIGAYEYLGNFLWRIHRLADRAPRVKLSLW